MNVIKRATAGAVLAGSLFLTGGLATTASAAVNQDGLVNVNVGDVTILENVRVAVAAKIVAQICGVKVGPVAVLGQAVDRSGATRTVCTVDEAPITIVQN